MGRGAAEGPWPAGGSPRRQSSWLAALLVASILYSCFLLTQAGDIPVTLVPQTPQKGDTVTLTPGGSSTYVICVWYRGEQRETDRIITHIPIFSEQQIGPGFTGREAVGSGCSLEIKDLNKNDSAMYIVRKVVKGGPETGHVKIKVPDPPASSMGVVGGIGIGALAGTVLIGVLVYYCVRRFKRRADKRVSMSSASPPVSAAREKA